MSSELKIQNAYTIGDVAFYANWEEFDEDEPEKKRKYWISVRYAGYNADGSLFFQWTRGGSYYSGLMPHSLPEQTMRVEIAPIGKDNAVATWRNGPGEDDVEIVYYSRGTQGELLEIECEEPKSVQKKAYGFRQL